MVKRILYMILSDLELATSSKRMSIIFLEQSIEKRQHMFKSTTDKHRTRSKTLKHESTQTRHRQSRTCCAEEAREWHSGARVVAPGNQDRLSPQGLTPHFTSIVFVFPAFGWQDMAPQRAQRHHFCYTNLTLIQL